MLSPAPYRFLARPRLAADETVPTERNCRALIQEYLLDRHGRFWPRESIENPGLWHDTGSFIAMPTGADTIEVLRGLPDEAILFAERLVDAAGDPVDHSPAAFADIEEYRLQLHTAVYLTAVEDARFSPEIPRHDVGPGDPAVLHATSFSGCTCLWSPATFLACYKVVAVKVLPAA